MVINFKNTPIRRPVTNLLTLIIMVGIALLISSVAAADEEIALTIQEHRFIPNEINIKSGTKVKLVVTNKDKGAEEFESSDLNREKLIHPGQSITIHLPQLKPGTYEFFGEFHPETAKGKIIVE